MPEDTSPWLLGVPGAMAGWTPAPRQGKPGGGPESPHLPAPAAGTPLHQDIFPLLITSRGTIIQPGTLFSHILQKSTAVLWEMPRPQSASHPGLSRGEAWSPPLQIVLSSGLWAFENWSTDQPRWQGLASAELSEDFPGSLVGMELTGSFPRGRLLWAIHGAPGPPSCSVSEHSP